MINGMSFYILIDSRAAESFISPRALSISKLMAIEQQNFDTIELASRIMQGVGLLVPNCELDLGVCVTKVSLYTTSLGSYDIIVGMD